VEHAFRELTGSVGLRRIYHQTERRVEAHLFVTHLALLLGCDLRKALTRGALTLALDTTTLCARSAWWISTFLTSVSDSWPRPGPHRQAVLRAVGIPPPHAAPGVLT
jgi:hypothetical protein